MPNRILHESIKYCPKMEQLNWFEEVVYHRLTVTVDDYGCLDGRIVLLKNTLFPTREDISKDDIARAIEHMVALGLLRAYEAGGMPYLHFPAWEEEQRVRNKRRKFPAPPDEEEPLAAEDSLSAADGGALFAGEKHLTASCCQLTAGCPPESNPYPNPYPYPDSNPKFESGSVTNPYPIQAPGACAEERPRAGEQSLRHSLRCDTSLYSREAIDGAIPEDGVRPLAGESPRPASALPSEGAREAPREDGQSLHRGCAAPKGSPWHQGELSAKLTEGFFDPSVTATPCHRSTVQHGRLASCAKRTCDVPCFTGVFVPACASLARYSGAAERFALSSPLHPFGASTTTACFRHWRRPSCAPFPFGKKEAFGRATSYDCATNQKAPLDSKGAHEARALCAEQREVSPVRQGASQASPASEEKRLCRTVECCRRQPTEGLSFTQEQLLSGAIPENSACSSSGVPGIEKPPANASKEEYHAYLVRLQEHFAREDAAAAAERARQAASAPQSTIPAFVWETVERLRAQAAARRARERAESEASYRKALAAWLGDTSAEKAGCCA